MGMSPELIRREFKRKKSRSVGKSNHNELVCIRLLNIRSHNIDENIYFYP
jgi:hypothetical protein